MLAMNLIYIIMATLLLYMYKCRQKPSNEPQPKLDKNKPKVEEPVEDIEQPWGYFVFINDQWQGKQDYRCGEKKVT